MKSFQFSLQAVRTVREREEQQGLQDYLKALHALDEARRQAEAVATELAEVWQQLEQAVGGQSAASHVQRLHDYGEAVVLRKRERDAALHSARGAARGAFTRYLAAHQARTAVENLLGRQKAAWAQARRKHEQKLLDEIATRGVDLMLPVPSAEAVLWN